MKTCKSGQYYCTKDKKCKPIPSGYHVGRGGWLEKDDDSKKKNGNGNGNGHSNGNGNGSNGSGNGVNGSSGNGNSGGNGGGVSEEIEVSNWRDDFRATEYEFIDIIKPDPIVVEEPTVEWEDPTLTEAQRIQSRVGNIVKVFLRWKGRMFILQMFFPQLKKPNRSDVISQIQKVYPGSKLLSYDIEDYDPSEPMIQVSEGSLHKWFKGSKSKDGKKGWVNVVTGGTCASDEPGEGTPKCVSSSKRASMTKAERLSASRRKKKADPNQQSKTGAAKPTYVATDKKKVSEATDAQLKAQEKAVFELEKKEANADRAKAMKKRKKEISEGSKKNCGCGKDPCITYGPKKNAHKMPDGTVMPGKKHIDEEDKKGKGSGTKDACYHKVKASAKVWPSAYASGRLVQCRKKGAANYGKSKSESYSWRDEFDYVQEGAAWTKKEGKNKSGGLNEKGRKSYERDNPGSDLKAPSKKVGNPRRASFCARMKGMKKKLTSAKTARDPDSRINKSLRAWNC